MTGAFTLVELMVALALSSMILIIIAQVFSGASQLFTTAERSTQAYTSVRVVLDLMQQQIESLSPERRVHSGSENSVCGVIGVNNASLDEIQFRFCPLGESDQVVEYSVDTDGNLQWGFDDSPAENSWNPTNFYPIVENVDAFEVQYWDCRVSTPTWRDSWDATTYRYLPAAIRIQITITGVRLDANSQPQDLTFERVLYLPDAPGK